MKDSVLVCEDWFVNKIYYRICTNIALHGYIVTIDQGREQVRVFRCMSNDLSYIVTSRNTECQALQL